MGLVVMGLDCDACRCWWRCVYLIFVMQFSINFGG